MSVARSLIFLLILVIIPSCIVPNEPSSEALATPTVRLLPAATSTPTREPSPTSTSEPTKDVLADMILNQAAVVVDLLGQADMDALVAHVHPELGLRFSPYAYVHESDIVFSIDQIPGLFANNKSYLWGVYDGSGDPIKLTFAEYYDRFVYDQEFANAEETAFNRRIGGSGGTINNIDEFYPGSVMVEFHFSGFNPDYAGLDWRSLRLVFMQHEGEWLLVGIVHDEWTT